VLKLSNKSEKENIPTGQRLADAVAEVVGSWKFIIWQTIFVGSWVGVNLIWACHDWDPYPFIFLNLIFSIQAAYTGPIIMLSQNRQVREDRKRAEQDYRVNIESKREIENIIIKLNNMELEKLDRIISLLEESKNEKRV